MKQNSINILKYYVTFFLLIQVSSLEIVNYVNDTNDALIVYSNNETNPNFTYIKTSCCQIQQLFIENSNDDISNFTIFKEENDTFLTNNYSVFLKNQNLNITNQTEIFSIEEHPNIFVLQIFNVCLLNETQPEGNVISVNLISNNKQITFSFITNCPKKDISYFTLKKLLSIVILLVLVLGIVYFCGKFIPKQNYLSNNAINTQLSFKIDIIWNYGIYIIITSLILVWVVNYFEDYAVSFFSFFIQILCFLVMFMGISYMFKKSLKLDCFPRGLKEKAKQEYFNLKMYKIISVFLSLLIMILFIFFHIKFISNIIFFTLIFGSLSLLSVNNFTNIVLFTSCFISYDIFFLITSSFMKINYNTKALELIDQPIKLVIPNLITNNALHPCYFVSCFDVILIGLVIKYTRSFDILKGYNNFKYFKISVVNILLGSIGTLLFHLFYSNEHILLFPIELMLTGNILLSSFYLGEINDFMEGKNNIGMRKAVNDIIHSVEKIDDEDEEESKKGKYIIKDSDGE